MSHGCSISGATTNIQPLPFGPGLAAVVLVAGALSRARRRPVRRNCVRWRCSLSWSSQPLLLYPGRGFPLFEPDESRYAQIPREMMERGDLIVPLLQGEPYLDKPPLFYWLTIASYRLFGVSDWSRRLVPTVSLHLSVILALLPGPAPPGRSAPPSGARCCSAWRPASSAWADYCCLTAC